MAHATWIKKFVGHCPAIESGEIRGSAEKLETDSLEPDHLTEHGLGPST